MAFIVSVILYKHCDMYVANQYCGNTPSTQDVVHIAMSMIKIYKGKSTRSYLHLDFTDVVTILTIYYIISHVIYRIFNDLVKANRLNFMHKVRHR
jgi:hypothetical protein